jgi:hypothetical protein
MSATGAMQRLAIGSDEENAKRQQQKQNKKKRKEKGTKGKGTQNTPSTLILLRCQVERGARNAVGSRSRCTNW